jgi:hypothetical protein
MIVPYHGTYSHRICRHDIVDFGLKNFEEHKGSNQVPGGKVWNWCVVENAPNTNKG